MKLLCFTVRFLSLFNILSINAQLQYTPEQKRELIYFSNQCIAETGVPPYYVDQARMGNFIEDARLKNFLFCMAKKLGFQDEYGTLIIEKVRQRVSPFLSNPQLTEALIQRCAIQKATPGETAYDAAKCSFESTGIRLI